jgi:hypothetical protein
MKKFIEWLEEEHPEVLEEKFLRNLITAAAMVLPSGNYADIGTAPQSPGRSSSVPQLPGDAEEALRHRDDQEEEGRRQAQLRAQSTQNRRGSGRMKKKMKAK